MQNFSFVYSLSVKANTRLVYWSMQGNDYVTAARNYIFFSFWEYKIFLLKTHKTGVL